jgi:RNA polymerase subunit RPABC4/transcription elongation factor Spt4
MLWVCLGCTTRYAVDSPQCPHCGSTEYIEEGNEMAKITVHGGPSTSDDIGANGAPAGDVQTTDDAQTAPAAEDKPLDGAPLDETPAEVPESDVPVSPGEPYDTWLLVDLQDELAKRGLPKSGNKPELVQRLIDDDASRSGLDGA